MKGLGQSHQVGAVLMDPGPSPAFVYRTNPELANDIESLSAHHFHVLLSTVNVMLEQLNDGRLPIRTSE